MNNPPSKTEVILAEVLRTRGMKGNRLARKKLIHGKFYGR